MGWFLDLRKRREMGITILGIRRAVEQIKASGVDIRNLDDDELAMRVLEHLIDGQPEAFKDPSIDWDAILAFIEKLIPLILKILALFGL